MEAFVASRAKTTSARVPSSTQVSGADVFTEKWITRSSAQGNCSAKSLAASVMSSILPCPPCLPPVMLSMGWGSCLQQGGPASGRGGSRGRG